MRNGLIVGLMAAALIVSGCGSKKPKEEPNLFADCTFPDAPQIQAPSWVCGIPVAEYPMSAVGSAQPSAAGFDFMKEQAAASARVQLAQQMQVHVTNMVKQYVETTGQGDSETVDQVRASVSKVITNQFLVGSRIVGSRNSPNGYMYVLVAVDESAQLLNTQNALRTSMNNDNALWQQFRAEQGFDELAQEIARQ